jgi:tetratricopeptide (TPR) repeat protein
MMLFAFTLDARNGGRMGQVANPIRPDAFSEIHFTWQQILRDLRLQRVPDFEVKLLEPDEERRELYVEAAVTTGICLAQAGGAPSARVIWMELLSEYGYEQPEILLNIGQSYSDEGNFTEAEEWLDMAVERATTDRTRLLAHYNRGLALANRGAHERAIKDFQTTLQTAPGFSAACNSIAACCWIRSKKPEWQQHLLMSNRQGVDIPRQ